MKKIFVFLLLLGTSLLTLGGCNLPFRKDKLYISASSTEYYIDKKSDYTYHLKLEVDDKSVLSKHSKTDVQYYIKGENICEAVMVGDSFTAVNTGTVTVSAKINDLESSNDIVITVRFSDEFIASNESEVANKLEEISKKTIDFGSINNIGIMEENADKYHLLGCDDIMFINDKGQLEVCGVMLSTEVTLHSDVTNKDIWKGDLSSTFGTILATSVKNELISNNIISKYETKITKTHMSKVKKLNLDGLISNDVTSINGLRWLTNLEELNLSNNGIDNIDFAASATKLKKLIINNNNISTLEKLKEHKEIEYLDISNNLLNNVDYIHRFTKLTYLNLSSNSIDDITNVGNLVNIESLFLNDNSLKTFKDALAALNNLKELGLGYCGLTFTDIKSIKFIDKSNITYLDFSGSNVNLTNLTEFRNVEELILQEANLNDGADIALLNELPRLKYLDISKNDLNLSNLCSSDGETLSFKLKADSLRNLETLCLGGNEFSTLPDLSSFVYLKTLDLTNAYNLKSLESLGKLNIQELILDECNSIKIDDDSSSYLSALSKENLPKLERLSIVSGLNYMTNDLYLQLTSKVKAGEFKLKFINDDYIDQNTIYNYTQSIYFSMEEFIKNVTILQDENIVLNPSTEEIILSLVNDRSETAKEKYLFYVPASVSKISIYGNEYDTYNIAFNILDRKQSSITFDLSSFNDKYLDNHPVISSVKGAKVYINTFMSCNLYSNSIIATINVYDLHIKCNNGKFVISARNGVDGKKGDDFCCGENGENGSAGIICNSIVIKSENVYITGGNGGNGGKAGDVSYYWAKDYNYSIKSGNGGNAGAAIIYTKVCNVINTSNFKAGTCGISGLGSDVTWKLEFNKLVRDWGPRGDNGVTPNAIVKNA